MIVAVSVALAALIVLLAGIVALRTPAAELAGLVRFALPLLLMAVAVPSLMTGRAGLALVFFVLFGVAIWHSLTAHGGDRQRGRSYVRSAGLEMELDLAAGALNGLVLAGRYDGRRLSELNAADLLALHRDLESDAEGRALLETYLDGRLPGWRAHAKPERHPRLRCAPAPGAMTKEEAYQILGLGSGAGEAEIRKAHRRLMKRMQPKLGASGFLADRINEAKDILLRRH